MQNKNVLNKFRDILGEYCAINQFIELSKRNIVMEYGEELFSKEKLKELACENSLVLTCYDSELMIKTISRSYIVNVHLCFETFLKELCYQLKSYGVENYKNKEQDESWLSCATRNITRNKLPENLKADFSLCEYYRLIRNSAVHDLYDIRCHEKEFVNLSHYNFRTYEKFSRLSAPNKYEEITFDDFVMFSRSANEVATFLFDNCKFNYAKIIADIPQTQINKWKKWTHNRQRCERAILLYMRTNFKEDGTLTIVLSELVDSIMAR